MGIVFFLALLIVIRRLVAPRPHCNPTWSHVLESRFSAVL
jgi:hypothetical protein